jgi:hypothetical protein
MYRAFELIGEDLRHAGPDGLVGGLIWNWSEALRSRRAMPG